MPSYVLKRNLGRTNCLTYVPNNLNVVLSNGRVVIKAGSKIYVPNGFESNGTTRKFDEVVLTSDITSDTGACSGLYCYNTAGWFSVLTNTVSGTSLASPAQLQGWYDTANNMIKRYNNQVGWQTPFSFPICRVTSNGTNITSIDQIFQWCGNFGSHQFFLPGIKGLKSNGFNADGTYKNIEVETKSVILNQYTYQATNQQVFIANNGTAFLRNGGYYSQETAPALAIYSVWHNTKDNFNYYIGDDTSTGWVKSVYIDFPAIPSISTNSSYQVTSLTPATVRTTPTIKDYVLKRRKIIPEETQDWTQPIATANKTAIEGGDMVITSTSGDTGSTVNYAWYAMDNTFSGNRFWEVKAVPSWWQVKFPYKLKITGLKYYKANNDANNTTSVAFYTSSDMTTQIGTTTSTGGSAWQGFDISGIPTAGIITDTIYVRLLNSTSNYTSIGELQITAKKVIPKHVEDTNYVLRRK